MEFTERRWFYQVWRLLLLPVCRDSRRYSSIPDQLLQVFAEQNVKQAAMDASGSRNPGQDNGLRVAHYIYRFTNRTTILTYGIHTINQRDQRDQPDYLVTRKPNQSHPQRKPKRKRSQLRRVPRGQRPAGNEKKRGFRKAARGIGFIPVKYVSVRTG